MLVYKIFRVSPANTINHQPSSDITSNFGMLVVICDPTESEPSSTTFVVSSGFGAFQHFIFLVLYSCSGLPVESQAEMLCSSKKARKTYNSPEKFE